MAYIKKRKEDYLPRGMTGKKKSLESRLRQGATRTKNIASGKRDTLLEDRQLNKVIINYENK